MRVIDVSVKRAGAEQRGVAMAALAGLASRIVPESDKLATRIKTALADLHRGGSREAS